MFTCPGETYAIRNCSVLKFRDLREQTALCVHAFSAQRGPIVGFEQLIWKKRLKIPYFYNFKKKVTRKLKSLPKDNASDFINNKLKMPVNYYYSLV